MALHILNFSFDAPDALDYNVPEDLSYNEIESFTEWFAEDVLNLGDTFKETDEQGNEENGFIKKVIDIKFYRITVEEITTPILLTNIKNNSTKVHYSEPFCAANYLSVFSPPPEA